MPTMTMPSRDTQPNTTPPQSVDEILDTTIPCHSVCVQAAGRWIYIAEFRTYAEATFIAQSTYVRTGMPTKLMSGPAEVWTSPATSHDDEMATA